MTKEEKIQEAYGEYWEELKQYVNMDDGIAEVPSSINRTEYLKKFKFIANYPDINGFKQMLIPQSIERISDNNGWEILNEETYEGLSDDGFYMLYNINNGEWAIEELSPSALKLYTHCQEIQVPPKPPIY